MTPPAREHGDVATGRDAPATAVPAGRADLGMRALGVLAADPALARAIATGMPLSNRGVVRSLARRKTQEALKSADIYDELDERNESDTPFREEIVKLIAQVDATGVTEKPYQVDAQGKYVPGTGGIGKWVGGDQLFANRKQLGQGYTSCGTFLSNVWNMAKAAALKSHPKLKIDTSKREFDMHNSPVAGAWNEASKGMSKRPRPGDAYYLQFADTRKQSHVGIIKSISKLDGGKERWVTADGGQREVPGGMDKVCERTRIYVPSENLVYGGENGDTDPRWLFGWTDVDQLVFY